MGTVNVNFSFSTSIAAAASPKSAALSGSLGFLPKLPRSDEIIKILSYTFVLISDLALFNAIRNDKHVP